MGDATNLQGDFFEPWRPAADSVHIEGTFPVKELFGAHSAPLSLPGSPSQHVILPIFQSASSSGKTVASQDGLTKDDIQDAVLHVGGSVWAMGWCPAEVQLPAADAAARGGDNGDAPKLAAHYLAVGCHPLQSTHNQLGKAVTGPALIQLWQVASPSQPEQQVQQWQQDGMDTGEPAQQSQQGSPALTLPEMVMGIAHDGGLTWQCQWCPDAELADDLAAGAACPAGYLPRLGLLAAVLGDGTMRVWAVPHPSAERQQCGISGPAEEPPPGSPLVASLDPVAVLSSQHLAGSMPALLDWLPAKPHDLLLVGCWDGSVAIAKLAPSSSSQSQSLRQQQQQQQQPSGGGSATGTAAAPRGLELLSFFRAEPLALRALQWIPPAPCAGALDLLHRHVFLTAGHEGSVSLWDDRDQFTPLYRQVLSTNTVLNGAWTTSPLGMLLAMEDASLRGLPLDSTILTRNTTSDKAITSINWRGLGMGALWALDVHPAMQLVAYGGEDGEVGVFAAEYEGDTRRRATHTPVAGIRKEEDVLVLKSTQHMLGAHGLYAGKVQERLPNIKNARFPHELEAVHRVAWYPGGRGAAWLASGGAAGVVRLQWVARR